MGARTTAQLPPGGGDVDLAALGAVLADRARVRILLALGDGRALAASVLAAEAGISTSTASSHLARLVDSGLLVVTARISRHCFSHSTRARNPLTRTVVPSARSGSVNPAGTRPKSTGTDCGSSKYPL